MLNVLDRSTCPRFRSALRAALDQAVVLARGVDHLSTFPDEVRERLLAVNVFAGGASGDRRQSVVVLHRGDGDDIQLWALDHLAVIGVFGHLVSVLLLERCRLRVETLLVGIANGGHSHSVLALESGNVRSGPAISQTDDADVDFLVGISEVCGSNLRHGKRGSREGRSLYETSSSNRHKKVLLFLVHGG